MKMQICSLGIILIMWSNIAISQSGWYQQESGTTVNLNKIFMVNENSGCICGDSGRILKTTNGGTNWILQNSGTNVTLRSVFFLNENAGWAAVGTLI